MNLNKICRICLSKKYELKDIFNVIDIIKTIAPIQLKKEDGLPSTICSECLSQANQAYIFRLLCIQSDAALRQQVFVKGEPADVSTYTENLENDSQINYEEVNTNELNRINTENNSDSKEDLQLQSLLLNKEETGYFLIYSDSSVNDADIVSQINDEVNKNENTNESNRINSDKNNISEEIVNCRFCDTQFNNRKDYLEHERNHKRELKCHTCGKILTSFQRFRKHIYMHKQKGSYLCETCGKVISRLENFKLHERIHTGVKPYKCSFCDKSFIQSGELKSHIVTHTKEKPYLCIICGLKFARIVNLRCHMKRTHSTSPEKRPCICVCGKSFKDQSALNEHQKRVHTTERKYVCGECNKGFKRSTTLRQHEKIHKADRPFVCSTCGRGFIFKHVLQSHMNTHSK